MFARHYLPRNNGFGRWCLMILFVSWLPGSVGQAASSSSSNARTMSLSALPTNFNEEFSSTMLDPAWNIWAFTGTRTEGQSEPANHYSLSDNPGFLRYVVDPMTHPDGFLNSYQTTDQIHSSYSHDPGLELQRSFSGEQWQLDTRVTYNMPFSNGRNLDFRVYFGDGGPGTYAISFERHRDGPWPQGTPETRPVYIRLLQKEGPSFADVVILEEIIPEHSPVDTYLFRVLRNGGNIVAQWSSDGVSWSTAFQRDLGNTISGLPQRIVLSGLSWFTPEGSYADYDYIRLSATGSIITGQIQIPTGSPLAGVVVMCGTLSTITDAQGDYTIVGVPDGTCTLTPVLGSYQFTPASRTVTVPPNANDQDFTATTEVVTSSISGRITTAQGAPVAGVTIDAGVKNTTTGTDGRYTLAGLVAGSYTLTPSKPDFRFTPASMVVSVPGGATNRDFTAVDARPTSALIGYVRLSNNQPLNGVTINISNGRGVTTGGPGVFEIGGFLPGSYTITPVLAGYVFSPASRTVMVPPNANELSFTAMRLTLSTLSGQITTPNGRGFAGVTIALNDGRTVRTDSNGSYQFTDVASGRYTLIPSKLAFSFSPPLLAVTVPPNATNQNFVAHEGTTASIIGQILGPNNAPLAGITITTAGGRSVTTDSNGIYQLSSLQRGTYTLTPVGSNYRFSPPSTTVTVALGEITLNFSGTPISVSSSIAGRVYFDRADPSKLAAGILVQACRGTTTCASAFTDNLGQYRFSLVAGQYNVTAYPSGRYMPTTVGPLTVQGSTTTQAPNLVLLGATGTPPDTTIVPSTTRESIAKVGHGQMLTLTHQSCPEGSARYQVLVNGSVVRAGVMFEQSTRGRYTVQITPLSTTTGYAQIKITVTCKPVEPPRETSFNIYIDPSGFIKTTDGAPIAGATVTLYRANTPDGPFELVEDGSLVMSTANRSNPDRSDATGHFGWDVIPGYYKVRAEKLGCIGTGNITVLYVETGVLTIPPPVTDLDLRLHCNSVFLPFVQR